MKHAFPRSARLPLNEVVHGDCIAFARSLPDGCVSAVVTDPPYELGFMGRAWDKTGIANSVELWAEIFRVLKPGGHLLAFGAARTYHRMACAIEDAGFEIRDCIRSLNGRGEAEDVYPAWVFGSGFPKSLDVSKALDKAAGAVREVVGVKVEPNGRCRVGEKCVGDGGGKFGGGTACMDTLEKRILTAPASVEAKEWEGWGTALKPAWEPVVLARKPLIGTVVENVRAHGTGAVNVDGCRVATESPRPALSNAKSASGLSGTGGAVTLGKYAVRGSVAIGETSEGRWPANVIHDGSEEVLAEFAKYGERTSGNHSPDFSYAGECGFNGGWKTQLPKRQQGDSGSAARFFYTAKASRAERGHGNIHPTVKPLALMRYLVRLITPPGGVVLDPFAGSGTTLLAARQEGFAFLGCDMEAAHVEIARRRLAEELPFGGTEVRR